MPVLSIDLSFHRTVDYRITGDVVVVVVVADSVFYLRFNLLRRIILYCCSASFIFLYCRVSSGKLFGLHHKYNTVHLNMVTAVSLLCVLAVF